MNSTAQDSPSTDCSEEHQVAAPRPPWSVLLWLVSLAPALGTMAFVAGGRIGLEWILVGIGVWVLWGAATLLAVYGMPPRWFQPPPSLWAAFTDLRRKSLRYRDIPDPLPLERVDAVQGIVCERMDAEEALAEALVGRGVPRIFAFKVTFWLAERLTPRPRVQSN